MHHMSTFQGALHGLYPTSAENLLFRWSRTLANVEPFPSDSMVIVWVRRRRI